MKILNPLMSNLKVIAPVVPMSKIHANSLIYGSHSCLKWLIKQKIKSKGIFKFII